MKKTIWILGPKRKKVEKVTNRVGVIMRNEDHRNVLVLTGTTYGYWPNNNSMIQNTIRICQIVREQGITPVCGFVTGHLDVHNYVFDSIGTKNIIICYLADYNEPNTPDFTEPFYSDIRMSITRELPASSEAIMDHVRPKLDGVKAPSIGDIFGVCCEYVGVSTDAARQGGQAKDLVAARQLTAYFSRKLTHANYSVIGDFLRKDRNTMYSGACVVETALDPKFKDPFLKDVNFLTEKFNEMYNIRIDTEVPLIERPRLQKEIFR